MAAPVLVVHGMRDVRRTLKALGDDLADLKDANAAVATLVAQAAAAQAPRRSGRLAASLRGNRAVATARVLGGSAEVPYAAPVHWGWPARGIEPNPFAVRAAEQTQPVWLAVYAHDVERVVARLNAHPPTD